MKNFKLEVEVAAKHHYTLIGRRGASISKIQQQYDVQVQFPEKGSPNPDTIIITGLEKDATAARDDILKRVKELVCSVKCKGVFRRSMVSSPSPNEIFDVKRPKL